MPWRLTSEMLRMIPLLTAPLLPLVGGTFDPDVPLNQVPFLMSHDTATGYLGEDGLYDNPATGRDLIIAWSKTQIGNVSAQLGCGARAFDMRPYLTEDGELIAHHGDVIIDHPFRDMMEEMVVWASQNPNELVLAEVIYCKGASENLTEQCDLEAKKVLQDLKIPLVYRDECPDALKNMTLGGAMKRSALETGGAVLAIWGECFVSNYDSSRNCRGYEYESEGVSRKYSCWIKPYGINPKYPVNRILEYLDETYTAGPPSNGSLWQMQALWQATGYSVSLGTYSNSSLLMDVLNSRLNRMLFEKLAQGTWKMTQGGPNMFEVDFVCDQGNNIRLALDPNFNGMIEDYPDNIEVCQNPEACPRDSDLIDLLPIYYRGPSFKSNAPIRRYHNNARWGNTNDIVKFVRGTDEERNEYIDGLFGTSILLWCIFGLWSVVLIYCKWKNKLGCLVGVNLNPGDAAESRVQDASHESRENNGTIGLGEGDTSGDASSGADLTENNVQLTEKRQEIEHTGIDSAFAAEESAPLRTGETVDSHEDNEANISLTEIVDSFDNAKKKVRRVRITAITCGIFIVLFSGLLLGLGFEGLDDTIDSAQVAIPDLREVVSTASDAANDFLLYSNYTTEARIQFLNYILVDCEPLINPISRKSPNVFFLVDDDIIFINETLNNFTFVTDEVSSISRSLEGIDRDLTKLESNLNKIDDSLIFYISIGFIIPYALMVIMFTMGIILAWRRKQPRLFMDCPTRVALPIFLFFLVASYVSATFLLMGSTFTADFCIDTPDNQVIRMVGAGPPFDENVEWYVGGCDPYKKPELLYDHYMMTIQALQVSSDFFGMLSTKETSTIPCNNASQLLEFASITQLHINAYSALLVDLVESLECSKFNPLYAFIAYTTTCHTGFDSLVLTFVFLFGMAIASIVLVTLRVAWLDIEDVVDRLERPNGMCTAIITRTLRTSH